MERNRNLIDSLMKQKVNESVPAPAVREDYSDFISGLNHESGKIDNLSYTDNGALVYSSTTNMLVDFMSRSTEFRNKDASYISSEFGRAFNEDPVNSVKLAFQTGDIREGKGERKVFNACMDYLEKAQPQVLCSVMEHIPEYTRWDYLVRFAASKNRQVRDKAFSIIDKQFKSDIRPDNENPSLLCKWMPSLQSKKDEDRKLAHTLLKHFGMDYKQYRKALSGVREKLNVIEKNLSQNRIDEIDQEALTSYQQLKYGNALARKAPEIRQEYLDKVMRGEARMNAGVLYPCDILHKYKNNRKENLNLEALWKMLPDKVGENGNTLVIRDGSASMTIPVNQKSSISCLDVATAFSIYTAEKLSGAFKDKFITFSSRPELVDLSGHNSLRGKIDVCNRYTDCSNTNLETTFDLILDVAVKNRLTQNQIPKNLLILSDMQFDMAMEDSIGDTAAYGYRRRLPDKDTLFDTLRNKWNEAGYELPTLVFWHINGEKTQFPEIDSKNGVINLSGFSTNTLEMLMKGEFEIAEQNKETGVVEKRVMTPFEQLHAVIDKPRYDIIGKAVQKVISKEFEISEEIEAVADDTGLESDTLDTDEREW